MIDMTDEPKLPALTPEERGLLIAFLAWRPARGLFENDERVKAWLAINPDRRETIRILQLLLLHSRFRSER